MMLSFLKGCISISNCPHSSKAPRDSTAATTSLLCGSEEENLSFENHFFVCVILLTVD